MIERTQEKKVLQVAPATTLKDIMLKAGVNPVEVVPAVNNTIVTEDYKVKNNDKIELLSVVSGG